MSQFAGVGASLDEGGTQGRFYGPSIGPDEAEERGAFVRPAGAMSPRAVAVPAAGAGGQPVQLANIKKVGWTAFEQDVWSSVESKAFQAAHPGLQNPWQ